MNTVFYHSLQHYQPVLWCGKGPPLFMKHSGCSSPLCCLLILNTITILIFLLAIFSTPPKTMSPADFEQQTHLICILNTASFCTLNLSYLLTMFLNPGIIDPDSITAQTFEAEGRQFCIDCNLPKTSLMKHCSICAVCVRNLDHHCGFFQKCIAGTQTYFFYLFMLANFVHFIIMILTLGTTVAT